MYTIFGTNGTCPNEPLKTHCRNTLNWILLTGMNPMSRHITRKAPDWCWWRIWLAIPSYRSLRSNTRKASSGYAYSTIFLAVYLVLYDIYTSLKYINIFKELFETYHGHEE
uniref:AsIV-cont00166-ORF1 n=1 Tax=Apophua simplicipes ichnovirus TaxID=1329648 RepID=S5DZ16_9VIRU|nr:AsIV-cont00166-ORF1 [Apophua simplicipes ichnovirus]